jgi:hypothetical protein
MKFIYIDTNQYRHLFSQNKGFSEDIHQLICNLVDNSHAELLLPDQTDDEIERNRLNAWPDDHNRKQQNQIEKLRSDAKNIDDKYSQYSKAEFLSKEISAHADKLKKEASATSTNFTSKRSNGNKLLSELRSRAQKIQETSEIIERSKLRRDKKNPPFTDGLGDHLIWESVVDYLRTKSKPQLIFVGRDDKAWGKDSPNQWLVDEFKKRTSGSVTFIRQLSDIPGLTAKEAEKIRVAERENNKNIALEEFVSSSSFMSAGDNIQKILEFRDILDEGDIVRIYDAARTNSQIYQSFFTKDALKTLLSDENGFALPVLDDVDDFEWKIFIRRNAIELPRQSDEPEEKSLETILDELDW